MGHSCASQRSRAPLSFPERVTGVRGALPRQLSSSPQASQQRGQMSREQPSLFLEGSGEAVRAWGFGSCCACFRQPRQDLSPLIREPWDLGKERGDGGT